MPKKKQFLDKKKAVTFHLIHRSQKDPLQADEDAPKRLLQPVIDNDPDVRLEEQRKFGIFYDDEYDYLQHLKDSDELNDVAPGDVVRQQKDNTFQLNDETEEHADEGKLQLPSSVFGSAVEADVGMLNRAAPLRGPQVDWDPDIVAALDDDFNFDDPDNELEDDFVVMANDESKPPMEPSDGVIPRDKSSEKTGDVASDEAEMSDEDEGSDVGSFGDQSFGDFETKTRFTNYSMSSSVIRRNDGLTLLDDRFEKLYEGYDDDEIGALDQEDIGGTVSQQSKLLTNIMEEFEEAEGNKKKLKDVVCTGEDVVVDRGSDSDDGDLVNMVVENKDKWDCESIISTYSNIYNHPKQIVEPKKLRPIELTKRVGIPSDALAPRGPTRKQIEEDCHSRVTESANTYRPKDESTEEKRARKKAVKEERKGRREEKKANKTMFKEEEKRQKKEVINVRNNVQGMQIV